MNLLAKFEELAEQLFTGVFKKNATRLQPVEVAKELVKAMWKNKQISISKVYVPNVYRVYLHPSDWGPLASFGDTFLIELSKYIWREGQQSGYTFLTKPAVELHSDETIAAGEMFIEVDFDDSIVIEWPEDESEAENEKILPNKEAEGEKPADAVEMTTVFQKPVPMNWGILQEESRNYQEYLEIIEGIDGHKVFNLDEEEMFVGRHSMCQVVLSDPEVSRRHLKLTFTPKGWVIDDLGSTNGTYVNGARVDRQIIAPGDKIRIGSTLLALKTRESH